MKTTQSFAGLVLAASLFLAPILSTAQAQKSSARFAGKPTSAPPSVIGGAAVTVSVYNYMKNPVTPYWVDQNGILQLLPGAGLVAPMTGSTPASVSSYRGATLAFRGPRGGGAWKHFALNGNSPTPFIVLGTPPPGAALPPGYKKGGGSAPIATTPPAPSAPGTTVNKTVVNKTVTNNPQPAAPEEPAAPGKGRKKVVKQGDVNITVNPPAPSDTPAPAEPSPTTPTSPAEPAAPTAAGSAADADTEGELQLSANDPRVVEFLRIHNAARKDVGVSPLEWSEDLAATAQEWADELAHSGKLEHRTDSEYGENLASGKGNYTAAAAANAWLAEKAKYSPDGELKYRVTKMLKGKGKAPVESEGDTEIAHYSQMVWGKSTMVGFGIAKGKGGRVVVVANYNPRGNIQGEKPYEK